MWEYSWLSPGIFRSIFSRVFGLCFPTAPMKPGVPVIASFSEVWNEAMRYVAGLNGVQRARRAHSLSWRRTYHSLTSDQVESVVQKQRALPHAGVLKNKKSEALVKFSGQFALDNETSESDEQPTFNSNEDRFCSLLCAQRHQPAINLPDLLMCSSCDKTVPRANCASHLFLHIPNKVFFLEYACDECGKSSASSFRFARHLVTNHLIHDPDMRPKYHVRQGKEWRVFACEWRACYNVDEPTPCQVATRFSRETLQSLLKEAQAGKLKDSDISVELEPCFVDRPTVLMCELCETSVRNQNQALLDHVMSHTDGFSLFTCIYCQRCFNKTDEYIEHVGHHVLDGPASPCPYRPIKWKKNIRHFYPHLKQHWSACFSGHKALPASHSLLNPDLNSLFDEYCQRIPKLRSKCDSSQLAYFDGLNSDGRQQEGSATLNGKEVTVRLVAEKSKKIRVRVEQQQSTSSEDQPTCSTGGSQYIDDHDQYESDSVPVDQVEFESWSTGELDPDESSLLFPPIPAKRPKLVCDRITEIPNPEACPEGVHRPNSVVSVHRCATCGLSIWVPPHQQGSGSAPRLHILISHCIGHLREPLFTCGYGQCRRSYRIAAEFAEHLAQHYIDGTYQTQQELKKQAIKYRSKLLNAYQSFRRAWRAAFGTTQLLDDAGLDLTAYFRPNFDFLLAEAVKKIMSQS